MWEEGFRVAAGKHGVLLVRTREGSPRQVDRVSSSCRATGGREALRWWAGCAGGGEGPAAVLTSPLTEETALKNAVGQ